MSRSKVLLLTTVILVLGAGVVVGRLWARLPQVAATKNRDRTWLSDQLHLSPDQRQAMDAIWDDTKQKIGKSSERRQELAKDRDQAIQALLSDEQRAAYEVILDEFHSKRAELDKERERLVREANERSKNLLNDEQKARWEAVTKDSHEWHGPHGPSSRRQAGQGDSKRDGGRP